MLEGLLRHCTDAEIEANYTDTHGASIVGFAFCHLLGFRLLPRLKNIGAATLYRPAGGAAYSGLDAILTGLPVVMGPVLGFASPGAK